MAIDVSKLEDHAITDCRTAEDAQSVLWFFAAIRDILNAECGCTSAKLGQVTADMYCYPCLLRTARDRED